jgi:succinate-acetate transporter protein
MIVLFYVAVALVSFTRIPMWLQVALMLIPPMIISAVSRDAALLKIAMLALLGALVVYAPIAYVGSLILTGGFRAVFRRLRVIYFFSVIVLFVGLVFNLLQLVGIL